jgi:hypothetical protein
MKSFSFKVVSINISVHLHVIFNWVRISQAEEAFIFGSLARNNLLFAIANPSKKNHEYKFFIIEA